MARNVLVVIGTRPNFIKVTQFKRVAESYPDLNVKIVHTGQHFDAKMADSFFEQLSLQPDYFLEIPATSANTQMAEIMLRLERLLTDQFKADLIVVVGDVNSTAAAALTANKLGIKLAHVESGLRSFDRTMPEELNRIITDELADLFFVTEDSGITNLLKEGKRKEQIFFVGNTMIDTIVAYDEEIQRTAILNEYGLQDASFVLMTMHRPATVDNIDGLTKVLEVAELVTTERTLVFPVHPRTLKKMEAFNLLSKFRSNKRVLLIEPLDYFSFQKLISTADLVITDSGGIQEETTFRKVPCITLRNNTERPVTCTLGSNILLPFDKSEIAAQIAKVTANTYKAGAIPPLWDGKATERIFECLNEINWSN